MLFSVAYFTTASVASGGPIGRGRTELTTDRMGLPEEQNKKSGAGLFQRHLDESTTRCDFV